MAIYTAAELAEEIATYKAGISALATAQSYSIGGRVITRADLPAMRSHLQWLGEQQDAMAGRTGPHITAGRVKR